MRKIKFYKQRDAMGCGVACLQMICSYYGKKYSTDELTELCGTTKIGVSLFELSSSCVKILTIS